MKMMLQSLWKYPTTLRGLGFPFKASISKIHLDFQDINAGKLDLAISDLSCFLFRVFFGQNSEKSRDIRIN
jgi:hypothetical protein